MTSSVPPLLSPAPRFAGRTATASTGESAVSVRILRLVATSQTAAPFPATDVTSLRPSELKAIPAVAAPVSDGPLASDAALLDPALLVADPPVGPTVA